MQLPDRIGLECNRCPSQENQKRTFDFWESCPACFGAEGLAGKKDGRRPDMR